MGWLYSEELQHPLWATIIIVIVHAIWTGFLLYVIIDKLILGDLHQFLEHFTNWSLTLVLLFSIMTLFTYAWQAVYKRVLVLLYLPTYGTTWVVYLGVAVIFLFNPGLLTHYFKRFDNGVVIVANEVFHSLPLIVQTTYGWYHAGLIRKALHDTYESARSTGKDASLLFILYQVYSPCLLLGLYALSYNANHVYDVDIPLWLAFLGILGILSIFNGVPFLYIVSWSLRQEKKLI